MSAVSSSADGAGVTGQVQVSLLKKSEDMQSNQVAKLLQSIGPSNLGTRADFTA